MEFLSNDVRAPIVLTISKGEICRNFTWFKGKILKIQQNIGRWDLNREIGLFWQNSGSGRASQNREITIYGVDLTGTHFNKAKIL